mgnify:CR=1 FL=1
MIAYGLPDEGNERHAGDGEGLVDAFERQPVIADQDDIVDNGEQDGQDDASRGNLGQAHADIREAVFADFPIEKIDRTQEDAADKDGPKARSSRFRASRSCFSIMSPT